MNWSGGKDSALALHYCLKQGIPVRKLLTNINAAYDRISMHGVRRALLEQQAASIGVPLETIELPEQPSMQDYEAAVRAKLTAFKQAGIDQAVFGDIFLEDLREYREQQLAAVGMSALFPLWKKDTWTLVKEFIDLGFKSVIVCTKSEVLDRSFCGRLIDHSFLADLPSGVDPCGENGEYHSFVYDGPIFSRPIPFSTGETIFREYKAPEESSDECFTTPRPNMGFYFTDLIAGP